MDALSYFSEGILCLIQELWQYALLAMLIITAYWYLSTPKGLPPGSAGLPLVGYFPFMDKQDYLTLNKLSAKFGNVFHLYFGKTLVIVLNDYNAIKEAFVNQAEVFSGRPEIMNFNVEKNDSHALTNDEGLFWQEHRRFLIKTLRDYGMGKIAMEPLLLDEIQYFIKEIDSYKGQPKDLKDLLGKSFANNVCILLSGKRLDYKDQKLIDLLAFNDIMTAPPSSSLAFRLFFPWLVSIRGLDVLTQRKKFGKLSHDLTSAIANIIAKEKETFVDGDKGNYVHAFFTEQNARLQRKDNADIFQDANLLHNSKDIMGAGSQTLAFTMLWGLLYMAREPKIQNRIQKEIDEIIGNERQPSWNDRLLTPYTEATLLEIQRKGSIIPLNLTHSNKEETILFGYRIPKKSYVISNLWSVHHDPKLWKNPHEFEPSRFLDESGKVRKPEYLIPFSLGKRLCAGESLAKMELYLYFTSILQRYTILPEDGNIPSTDVYSGFAIIPKTSTFRLVQR